jgi:protein arginine N-methyltransferase 3
VATQVAKNNGLLHDENVKREQKQGAQVTLCIPRLKS